MPDLETAFRADLAGLALAAVRLPNQQTRSAWQVWEDWHACRLIFADWLEEEGRAAEAALTRADWRHTSSISGGVECWTVALPFAPPRGWRLWYVGYTNGRPYLHFPPHTLRVLRTPRQGRLAVSVTRYTRQTGAGALVDTARCPEGLASLWWPCESEAGLFPGV